MSTELVHDERSETRGMTGGKEDNIAMPHMGYASPHARLLAAKVATAHVSAVHAVVVALGHEIAQSDMGALNT